MREMAEDKITHNSNCSSESHSEHLCYIVSQGFHLSNAAEYDALVKDAKFKCRHCGRLAGKANNLCEPIKL